MALGSLTAFLILLLDGVLIPTTSKENGTLGPVADKVKVKENVAETAHEALDHGKQIAQETVATAKDTAQTAVADIKDTAQSSAEEHGQQVKQTAQEHAKTTAEEARQATPSSL